MNFTVEVSDAQRLQQTLVALSQVSGVRSARRR
jgi:GTP pyrophosphokinase